MYLYNCPYSQMERLKGCNCVQCGKCSLQVYIEFLCVLKWNAIDCSLAHAPHTINNLCLSIYIYMFTHIYILLYIYKYTHF